MIFTDEKNRSSRSAKVVVLLWFRGFLVCIQLVISFQGPIKLCKHLTLTSLVLLLDNLSD